MKETMSFLTLSEVANILQIGPEAVRRAAYRKELRGTQPGGKFWLFTEADVHAYIDRGYNLPAPEIEQELQNDAN